jgi:hypothetical protein
MFVPEIADIYGLTYPTSMHRHVIDWARTQGTG